ncbi:hypothetical protein WOLCODRAFT_136097 [Wolfiporia cocos MD-104 SS10]|uniref:Uncharacterized protein n=1 Tax=Wolfiporia cocos (strain MD-104) TaxID=742152 RepID=A0A2H3JHF4_WOLCO|nr:hypothetical protein WOLCODRAFT_136097 [Wolfiporia cocos MD-104 SS10]
MWRARRRVICSSPIALRACAAAVRPSRAAARARRACCVLLLRACQCVGEPRPLVPGGLAAPCAAVWAGDQGGPLILPWSRNGRPSRYTGAYRARFPGRCERGAVGWVVGWSACLWSHDFCACKFIERHRDVARYFLRRSVRVPCCEPPGAVT